MKFIRFRLVAMVVAAVAMSGDAWAGVVSDNASEDGALHFASAHGLHVDAYLREVKDAIGSAAAVDGEVVGGELTTREFSSKYEVVYVDSARTIFSYRAEGYFYTGGAHGNRVVKVGTVEVKTGRRLTVADVIPLEMRRDALVRVKKAVIAEIGGEENLQGRVRLTENFYIAKDGVHFVFNAYEVASYAHGCIDVAVPAYMMRRPQGENERTCEHPKGARHD